MVNPLPAVRGMLMHHYKTNSNGPVTEANIIVGTTNNHAPISMTIRRAAQKLIQPGKEVGQGSLNMIELAFRLFDSCLSSRATHSLPGQARCRSRSKHTRPAGRWYIARGVLNPLPRTRIIGLGNSVLGDDAARLFAPAEREEL